MGRRLISAVTATCALALCVAGAALAADPPPDHPFGLNCVGKAGVRFCQGHAPTGPSDTVDTRVRSFDGVPLDADVTLPPASAGNGPFPTIVILHGWGGSKASYETEDANGGKVQSDGTIKPDPIEYHWNNIWYAQQGYAVLTYSARGWGGSCGAPPSRTPDCFQQQSGDVSAAGWNHLKDRRREVHDTQFLLGKLVDQGVAKADALGATGISYGGGESIELAYLRNRIQRANDPDPSHFDPWVSPGPAHTPLSLAAAYPRWPWSDLISSLLPNGRFLDYKNSTNDLSRDPPGIPIQSYISGLFATGLTGSFYAPPGVDPTSDLTTWNQRVAGGEPYSDPVSTMAFQQIHDFHQGFGTPNSHPAPMLIMNGWTDDLFPPAEALRVYNSLRASDPNADVALQLADLGHSRGSNKAADYRMLDDQGTAFFDSHLKGASDTPPPAPGSVTTFTQTCPKPAPGGGPFTAGSWPDIHPGAIVFGSAPPQTVTSGGGNPQTGEALEPAVVNHDVCTSFSDETAQGTATYRLPKSEGYTLLGLPTVTASITTQGVNGQLDSRLWDVRPDGTQILISRGAYRLEDNQTGTVTFQLHGNGWFFAKGHIPKLELLGSDAPYLRPSNGAFQVTVKDLALQLPVLEKPETTTTIFSPATPGQQVVAPPIGPSSTITPTQVREPQLRVIVKPRKTRTGRRTRFRFLVQSLSPETGRFTAVPGALLRFAGRRLRTDAHGRARMRVVFRRRGTRTVVARKTGFLRGRARVRVLRARHVRHAVRHR